ncbi:MAG: hypothetical protein HYX68_17415 [Planctomycetes bacterium]|jgi:hypothetical protein|nr:hypothetical protein [Planctomycetota bacterium]
MQSLTHSAPLIALLLACVVCAAQDAGKKKEPMRFGMEVDQTTFPQQTPKDAMKSIAKALDRNKIDYLLAHLADPAHVDYWVDLYKKDFPKGSDAGKRLLAFDRLSRETNEYFLNDPLIVKDLRVFAKQAEWKEDEKVAIGSVESIPARKVYFKKIGDRWFLENRQQ